LKDAEKSEDRKIKLQVEAKRTLALEKLFLSLCLIMCIPNDLDQISEQLEEIVELKQCFKNLGLGANVGKKQKTDSNKQEALRILFDILVAQLMKQQSFLREIANYVFKQFSSDLDLASLENLITIISTPNAQAADMVSEDGDSDEQSGEDYGAEDVSEDSDVL